LRRWSDLAEFAAGLDPGGPALAVFQWAVRTITDFYSDEWFELMAASRKLDTESIWARPLTNPIATATFVERAVRIAILPMSMRDELSAEVQADHDANFFYHLDLILEVAGLAIRDAWEPSTCPILPSGRKPDLRLTRPGIDFTVEVTTRGLDRATIEADAFQHEFFWESFIFQDQYGVELVTEQFVPVLDPQDVVELFKRIATVSEAVRSTGTPERVTVPGLTVDVYRAGDRPYGTIGQAPRPQVDPWARLVERAVKKALQTEGAGPTWIRVDESAGLYMLSRLGPSPLHEQLGYLINCLQPALRPFPHVRGIVVSFGAEPGQTLREVTVQANDITNAWAGPAALDRPLPGPRRRRTFVVPIEGGQRLLLPDQIDLLPATWYARESGWLDWGLQRLGMPLSGSFLSQQSGGVTLNAENL
jgi:hypothetical protein